MLPYDEVVAFPSPDGETVGYQMRSDNPPKDRNGNTAKWMSPSKAKTPTGLGRASWDARRGEVWHRFTLGRRGDNSHGGPRRVWYSRRGLSRLLGLDEPRRTPEVLAVRPSTGALGPGD